MATAPFAAVCVSAFLHALFHLAVRREPKREMLLAGALWASVILYFPFFLYRLPVATLTAAATWPVLWSAAFDVGYMFCVTTAYRHGDLSLVYPVARGTGVATTLALSTMVLRIPLGTYGLAGAALIVAGIFFLSLPTARGKTLAPPADPKAAGLAALGGLCIGGYTLVDATAVRHLDPFLFKYVVFIPMALGMTWVHRRVAPWREMAAFSARKWRVTGPLGFMALGTYLIVLYAMRVAPAPLVAALRESSILFAALLGRFVLGEKLTARRIAGCVTIAAGAALLKLT